MANIPVPKTNPDFGLLDLGMVTVAKVASERALAKVKFVGNSTLRSGIIKLILATGAYGFTRRTKMQRVGNWVSTAWAVDGAEDIVSSLMKRFGVGAGQSQTQNKNMVI